MITRNGSIGRMAQALALAGTAACGRFPGQLRSPSEIWLVPAPGEIADAGDRASFAPSGTIRIVIDSLGLRPSVEYRASIATSPRALAALTRSVAVVTTFQNGRYHPETIRALGENAGVAAASAGASMRLASADSPAAVILDFLGATPEDLAALMNVTRAFADSARGRSLGPLGLVVPAGDTVSYPGRVLARSADLIVIRLDDEHRPGTPPGPLASPDWLSRHVGMRAARIGASRIVAELPLFGYRWERDGTARRITYSDAIALVAQDAGALRRDEASGFLTASSARDGWEIWIGDSTTVERLIASARKVGVTRFALAGLGGADPALLSRLAVMMGR